MARIVDVHSAACTCGAQSVDADDAEADHHHVSHARSCTSQSAQPLVRGDTWVRRVCGQCFGR